MKTRRLAPFAALCLALVLVWSISIPAYATTYYRNYYTNGSSYGTFAITTTGSISQFTVQTQDFPSGSSIAVDVLNSNGVQVNQMTVWLNGNQKIQNQPLVTLCPAGTYTIRYSVYFGGSGWIGVWLY